MLGDPGPHLVIQVAAAQEVAIEQVIAEVWLSSDKGVRLLEEARTISG